MKCDIAIRATRAVEGEPNPSITDSAATPDDLHNLSQIEQATAVAYRVIAAVHVTESSALHAQNQQPKVDEEGDNDRKRERCEQPNFGRQRGKYKHC